MYMTLSWTHDLAEHMTTGGAQSGSVTLSLNRAWFNIMIKALSDKP